MILLYGHVVTIPITPYRPVAVDVNVKIPLGADVMVVQGKTLPVRKVVHAKRK